MALSQKYYSAAGNFVTPGSPVATVVDIENMEQISGVGRILENGLSDPEIHVIFFPDRLEQYVINPIDLSETIRLYYQNISAGTINVADSK